MDESYIEMRCYVKFALHFGFSEEAIKKELIKAGWPLDKVNKAIMEVKGIKPMQKPVQQIQAMPPPQAPAEIPQEVQMPQEPLPPPAPQ